MFGCEEAFVSPARSLLALVGVKSWRRFNGGAVELLGDAGTEHVRFEFADRAGRGCAFRLEKL